MFKVLNESYDNVIQSVFLTAIADYEFALEKLVPLIDKLDFQRNPLRKYHYASTFTVTPDLNSTVNLSS